MSWIRRPQTAPKSTNPARFRAMFVAWLVAIAGATLGVPAFADSAPVNPNDPKTPVTVTADSLPTAQHDGVAWQAVTLGGTVYVAGRFSNARPFGASPGTQLVSRRNILAFDLATGQLKTSFAPVLNGQALTITASPDGSRIYVGGDFTTVNGTQRNRIAALDPNTGALISGFAPSVGATVRGIVASNSTVWFGGTFTNVGSASRNRLAAVNASNGALLPWAPNAANGRVNALTLSPEQGRVVIGGAFTTLNGSDRPGYGLGMVDAATGASLPIQANDVVRDAGTDSAILSLSSDGTTFYGVGYIYGTGGNLEGAFAANWSDARIKWVEDCHGDSYGAFANNTAVYVAGHPHYCGNLGGYPETSPRTWHRAVAFSKAATGTLTKDIHGYPSFTGQPAPAMLNWFPDMDTGTASGQSQGPWAVTGTDSYVVMVGEFRNVNQSPQQGLSRFALKEIAPNRQGPRVSGSSFVPSLTSPGAGQVRVQWQANWDRDNSNLTYDVLRDGSSTPVYSVSQLSTFWQRPTLTFNDSGLSAGQHSYRIAVRDPLGNTVTGNTAAITIAGSTNSPPVASFTTSTELLTVSVDASASSDPDGTVSSYTWAFGDGGTATGATAQHTYAAAGTFTINLTVRDDDGASTSTSRTVTVSSGENQSPSAVFSTSVNQLQVSANASASSDPDGSIASYSWDFGDGGTGSGVTAQHSYATAGTYTVTLTVTDNAGATDTATAQVTVSQDPVTILAQDEFGRTLASGWGSADIGGPWSLNGSSTYFSVGNGSAAMNLAAGRGPSAYLAGVSSTATNSTVTVSLDKIGNGGGTFLGAIARRVGTSEYRGKVRVGADGTVTLQLTRLSGGTETTLSQAAAGMTLAAGQQLQLRVEAFGTSPTTLRAKVWRAGTTEPGSWLLTTTDNTAGLQTAGSTGLVSYLSGSATNAPVRAIFDNYAVRPA